MPAQILIVDDYPGTEKLFNVHFTRYIAARRKEQKEFNELSLAKLDNYEFIFASTSEEALKIIESGRQIDLVLSEFHPPQVDPITLLKEIKNKELNIRVVVFSIAGDFPCIKAIVMQEGAFDCALKGKSFDETDTIIKQALSGLSRCKHEIIPLTVKDMMMLRGFMNFSKHEIPILS